MSTWWQVRVSGGKESYAAQAAQAAFAVTDRMERLMSRFRDDSEISAISKLEPGGRIRLSREVFDCLSIAAEIGGLTGGSFDIGAAVGISKGDLPRWRLDETTLEIIADSVSCRLDLGAIAKGFTLDRIAEELADWEIASYLLMSSGSSILAGDPPADEEGWRVCLGESEGKWEVLLAGGAIGTSGTEMRGGHIIDSSTGTPSCRHRRSWAFSPSAAQADALSTAWMNMDWDQITACCERRADIGASILCDSGGMNIAGQTPAFIR
jgi:thiamine biosynthesis lipoprotein